MIAATALLLVGLGAAAAGQQQLHVDPAGGSDGSGGGGASAPLRSVAAALHRLRAVGSRDGGRSIVLHSGRHAPFALDARDSGLSIEGAPGAAPSVSGGVRISEGWRRAAATGAPSDLWQAPTPHGLPLARQIYIGGLRANRTKLWWPPGKWVVQGSSLISADPHALCLLKQQNPKSSPLELVWTGGCKEKAPHCAAGQHSYREARCPVASIEPGVTGGVIVTVAEPCFSRARELSSCGVPSAIENGKGQMLGELGTWAVQPGSFFFDPAAASLLYQAPPGWDPATSEVILPVNQTLLRVASGATDLSFHGITFEHGSWATPNLPAGFVDDQAGVQVGTPTPHGVPFIETVNKTIDAHVQHCRTRRH